MNVAVVIPTLRFRDVYGLVPAMHTGNRVWMDGEGDILMYAGITPPDTLRIGVGTRVWGDAVLPMHLHSLP